MNNTLNDNVLTQLKMIYTKVIKVKNSNVYVVVDEDRANLITSDGKQIFNCDYKEIHDNSSYIKVISTEGTKTFTGLYFKSTGVALEFDELHAINDVDVYIIVSDLNSKHMDVLNRSTGEKIWGGDLLDYSVRLGDKTTPICLNTVGNKKLALVNKEIKDLDVHLDEHYKILNKRRGKYTARSIDTNEEFTLNAFGQKY